MRKAIEVCFRDSEGEIEFFVPKGEVEEKSRREKEEAVIIGTNVSTYADTMRSIRAVFNPDEIGVTVSSVKTTDDKKVVLVTGKGEAEKVQKELETLVKGIDTKISGRANTQVVVLDVDASLNGKEIETFIKQATKIHETEVRHLRMGKCGTQIATVSLPAHAAEELLRKGEVKINWTMCRVKPKVSVLLCYNCLGIGHHSEIFDQRRTEKKCLNCSQVGHLNRDCKNGSFCLTCDRAGHRTGSFTCPSYKRKIQEATWGALETVRGGKPNGEDNVIDVEMEHVSEGEENEKQDGN